MTVEKFITELHKLAEKENVTFNEILSVGSGQGMIEGAPTLKVYHFFCVNVATSNGETKQLRVYKDVDENFDR